jgi:hypothetical protein
MDEEKIQDIRSIKKLLEDKNNFSAFGKAMPFMRPLLKLLKVDTSKMDDAFEKLDAMKDQLNRLVTIPDRFNDTFSSLGWIMYEMMNLDVAEMAISLAENESVDAAEHMLANYYTPEQVKWRLLTMYGVRAFHSRMELANKALIDYEEGRYHACVPVVLGLLDGMVNEIHGKQKGLRRGFSSEQADLEAWDSIAGHSKGLNELKKILNTGRYSTVTDPITIPYRNGIMHGMDLGYDNNIVAAKTWAALFAAREWALKAEQGLLEEQPEEPRKSWKEVFHVIDELNKVQKYQDEWVPREWTPQEETVLLDSNIFNNQAPEHNLAEFLLFWKQKNYGKMGNHLSRYMNGHEVKAFPAQLRGIYSKLQFTSFRVERIVETAPSITLISGVLEYIDDGSSVVKDITVRIIAETPEGEMALRITDGTIWRVMDMNILAERLKVDLGGLLKL